MYNYRWPTTVYFRANFCVAGQGEEFSLVIGTMPISSKNNLCQHLFWFGHNRPWSTAKFSDHSRWNIQHGLPPLECTSCLTSCSLCRRIIIKASFVWDSLLFQTPTTSGIATLEVGDTISSIGCTAIMHLWTYMCVVDISSPGLNGVRWNIYYPLLTLAG